MESQISKKKKKDESPKHVNNSVRVTTRRVSMSPLIVIFGAGIDVYNYSPYAPCVSPLVLYSLVVIEF